MTNSLDEAIKHCEEVADEQEQSARILRGDFYKARRESCIKCASDHRQLAEWLKELKAYKKAYIEIDIKIERDYTDCSEYDWTVSEGYCGAKNIIDRCIEEVNADG